MSEASRARRQRYLNIREELAWREAQAQPPESIEPGPDMDPSWGPVGSLAQRMLSPEAYAQLLEQHNAILARRGRPQDRTETAQEPRAPAETSEEPSAQNRVLDASEALLRTDSHGETPLYACPVCGEESAKASVALGVWHCTACGCGGRVHQPEPKAANW